MLLCGRINFEVVCVDARILGVLDSVLSGFGLNFSSLISSLKLAAKLSYILEKLIGI